MDEFTFNIPAYARDACHLCCLERGAYFALILHYYSTESPLLDDDAALANIAGLTLEQWKAMAPKIRPFFRKDDDGRLHLKRCDRDLAMRDLDSEPAPTTGVKDGKRQSRKRRTEQGKRIDEAGWTLTDSLATFAQNLGLDAQRTAETFRDYFLASRLDTAWKLDWDAAFRNWCRKDANRAPGAPSGPAGPSRNGHGGGYFGTLFGAR